eukprot:SAG22_NODE_3936_length_1462_cov_1.258254_1_plen_206_part_00
MLSLAAAPAAAADPASEQPRPPVVRGELHNVEHCPPRSPAQLWRGTTNLVTAVYDLEAAAPEDGGFGCVAGSHLAGYGELPFAREPDPALGYPPGVTRVPIEPGAAVVFAETLQHCSLPWQGPPCRERRTLFLKFAPRTGRGGGTGAAANNNELGGGGGSRLSRVKQPYRTLLQQRQAAAAVALPPNVLSVLGLDAAGGEDTAKL